MNIFNVKKIGSLSDKKPITKFNNFKLIFFQQITNFRK